MTEFKAWFTSKTIWAGILTVLTGVGTVAHAIQTKDVESGLAGVAMIGTGAAAIQGRASATAMIGAPPTPPSATELALDEAGKVAAAMAGVPSALGVAGARI